MGRSISYNKRELEKKREQKRKEKLKRKEERKANSGGSSLDDMIAYVDANGVITDEAPDPDQKREEVSLEDIAVSVPKKEDIEEEPLVGRVEHFKTDKGFGFIKDLASGDKFFFHITDAYPYIQEGATVSYELKRGQRGMNAVNIVPATASGEKPKEN